MTDTATRPAGPQVGRLMGFVAGPAVLGPVLGPILGGVLVDDLSWRWIFYINVPICLFALALARRIVPAERGAGSNRLDVLGALLLSPAFTVLIYGLAEAQQCHGFGNAKVVVPMIVGIVLLACYVRHALRHPEPLLDIRLLRGRSFLSSSLTTLAAGFLLMAAASLLQLFYQQVQHASPAHAGLLMIPGGIGSALGLIVGPQLLRRGISARAVALGGVVCAALGVLAFTRVDRHAGSALLEAAQAVGSLGTGLLMMTIMTVALTGIAPHLIPAASTGIRIVQQLGFSLGSALVFIILQSQFESHPGHPAVAYAHTYWWTLVAAAIVLPALAWLPGKTGSRG